jgi:hypothetical protein
MTEKLALEFRMKGAALARAKTDGFQGIYFGICTTLGTRIRNEVREVSSKYINRRRFYLMFILGSKEHLQISEFKGSKPGLLYHQ